MKPKNLYQSSSAVVGKSRIGLLIRVYDRTLGFLELAQQAMDAQDDNKQLECQLQVQKMILGLLSGVDLESGEVASNVARLLQFIMDQTVARRYADAIAITNQLRSMYAAIQSEVEALEESGQLPGLETPTGIEIAV